MSDIDNYISFSGLIGAGKSTMTKALGKEMKIPTFFENVKNIPILELFYKDMKKYGFLLQTHLLNKRFAQQQKIVWSKQGGIQDRSIYEDKIFATMLYKSKLMSEHQYKTYIELFENMSKFMQQPDFIIHLDIEPKEALRRIKLRNRSCEATITIEYLTALYNEYNIHNKRISKKIPIINVDYEKFKTPEEMAKMIKEEYKKISMITNVTI